MNEVERYENQPVRMLQHMLRRLMLEYAFLPQLAEDGIFGERTLEAVMLFQRELHPPVTGIVDRDTWNAIYELWQEMEQRQGAPRALRVFPNRGLRVEQGMQWETLVLPQTMFQLLSGYLEGIDASGTNGFHDEAFSRNIRWLQRAGGLQPSGTLDGQSWELLSRLYEVFVVKEKEKGDLPLTGGWG